MCPHTIYVSDVSAGKPWRRCSQDDPYACIPYHCAANQEGTTECKILQNNPIQTLVDMDVRCVLTTSSHTYYYIFVDNILRYMCPHMLYSTCYFICVLIHYISVCIALRRWWIWMEGVGTREGLCGSLK